MTDMGRRQVLCGLAATGAMLSSLRRVAGAGTIAVDDKSVLIVVDVQNCFLPGGSLAVKDGDQVIPVINALAKAFTNVVMTQDWHTPGHISFASRMRARSHSRRSSCPMATRCSGPTTVSRERRAPISQPVFPSRMPSW
jgi:nicotinamidase-related amidase